MRKKFVALYIPSFSLAGKRGRKKDLNFKLREYVKSREVSQTRIDLEQFDSVEKSFKFIQESHEEY